MHRLRSGMVVGLVCLGLAACGTTVPVGSSAVAGGGAPGGTDGLSLPSAAPQLPLTPGSDGEAFAPLGPGGVRATNPATPYGAEPPVGTLPPGTVPRSGRGYDASHVYLGFPTNNDVNEAAGALGLGALDFGDQNAIIDAVVAEVNARGGLLGRTVVAVKHDLKTADLQTDAATSAEETCRALTEDHQVVAVVNVVAAIDVPAFYSCLGHHSTPVVSAGFTPVDDRYLADYAPYLYRLTAASFSHVTPLWLDRLRALRYFTGWDTVLGRAGSAPVKVGLLYPSVQPQQRIFADVHKRLVARGITVVPDVQYSTQSLNAEGAAMSNAVLSFNSAGVTHVLSSDSDVLLFMQAADKQQYHPRYGLTSYHAPAAALQAIVPASQLVGALGIGWLPISDVDAAHSPGSVGSGEAACRKTMAKHGVDVTAAGAATVAFADCDAVGLLTQAFARVGGLAAEQLRRGVVVVGPSFSSALVWSSALSASRADLPGSARDIGFDGAAFHYLSTKGHSL